MKSRKFTRNSKRKGFSSSQHRKEGVAKNPKRNELDFRGDLKGERTGRGWNMIEGSMQGVRRHITEREEQGRGLRKTGKKKKEREPGSTLTVRGVLRHFIHEKEERVALTGGRNVGKRGP